MPLEADFADGQEVDSGADAELAMGLGRQCTGHHVSLTELPLSCGSGSAVLRRGAKFSGISRCPQACTPAPESQPFGP